jgi:hypothetical protein
MAPKRGQENFWTPPVIGGIVAAVLVTGALVWHLGGRGNSAFSCRFVWRSVDQTSPLVSFFKFLRPSLSIMRSKGSYQLCHCVQTFRWGVSACQVLQRTRGKQACNAAVSELRERVVMARSVHFCLQALDLIIYSWQLRKGAAAPE